MEIFAPFFGGENVEMKNGRFLLFMAPCTNNLPVNLPRARMTKIFAPLGGEEVGIKNGRLKKMEDFRGAMKREDFSLLEGRK